MQRKILLWAVFSVLFAAAFAAHAGDPPMTESLPKGKVLLLGMFHFENPGLDAVKYTTIDVMQAKSQRYLEALSKRLAGFRPTRILLEYPEESEAAIQQRYTGYLAGHYELGRNEIYQLGFRIARLAGHKRVYGFDRQAPADESKLWDYLHSHAPEKEAQFMAMIAKLSARLEHEHRTLSLRQLLEQTNAESEDRANKGFYMLLNDVGADEGQFHGADASANWWHRNFRMYAVVQSHAKAGERVLVIGGSGHVAILRDLLRSDAQRDEEPAHPYLRGR